MHDLESDLVKTFQVTTAGRIITCGEPEDRVTLEYRRVQPTHHLMPTYDPSNARCFVFTFKEGLLSPVAHDLRLEVTRFSIEVGEGSVVARFDTSSLRVDTPMKDGAENPSALGERDKVKIAELIREEVLLSARYPEARFESRSVQKRADGGYDLTGDLTLHGVTRPLSARTEAVGSGQQVELTLHQPEFGIVPYKAMMGTLKIRPDIRVRISTR